MANIARRIVNRKLKTTVLRLYFFNFGAAQSLRRIGVITGSNLKIVVNTRLLLPGRLDGIGWFSYQSLKRITQKHPDTHFTFLFDRPYDPQFLFGENVTPMVLWPPARHPFLFYYWMQFAV